MDKEKKPLLKQKWEDDVKRLEEDLKKHPLTEKQKKKADEIIERAKKGEKIHFD